MPSRSTSSGPAACGHAACCSPRLTRPDQRALVDLAKQEERRPEQSVEVTFTPEPDQPNGPKHPRHEQ
jgi:hypothetical protein